jgi:hypothetical protein
MCTFPNATGTCTNSTCGFTCLPGYVDLDGNPANGCEYPCTFQSSTDVPDMAFTDANCDGIDGEWNNGIFVAPIAAGGNDANPGTRTMPKATVASALSAAAAQGKRDVYIAAGTYAGQLAVGNVSGKYIAGGYSASDWKRSLINTTTFANGNPVLKVSGATNDTVQFITFLGGNATSGATAYAGWVEASNGLTLEGVSLAAGNGGDGADGANGGTGVSGNNGGSGNLGCTNDPDFGPLICSTCAIPVVGTSGMSACGESGGAGGAPGWTTAAPDGNGSNGGNGSGGALGGVGSGPEAGLNPPSALMNGQSGADGTSGNNGAGGSPLGALDAGYLASIAAPGQAGTNGRGGGGGGGGGGGCANSLLGIFCYCFSYGSSGGGGGAGGCAGPIGQPGVSGGASIGLLVLDSNVIATNVAITSGNGGRGGRGGSGGTGGAGGQGSASSVDTGQQGDSGGGGRGGNGGKGGNGGHGGGGGGGPSIGVARTSGSTFTVNNVSYSLGNGGQGGASLGNAGQQGTSEMIHIF